MSSPYHPQANEQVESTNKELENTLKKIVEKHHKNWEERMPEELWYYRTTWSNIIGYNYYEIAYGKWVLLPVEFQIRTLRKIT